MATTIAAPQILGSIRRRARRGRRDGVHLRRRFRELSSIEGAIRSRDGVHGDERDVALVGDDQRRDAGESGVGWTQVTVTNDGNTWSGFPNVYTKGSGTFLAFVYDDSAPGFYNGVRQDINVNGFRGVGGRDKRAGPYIGGTKVLVEAVGLAAGSTPGASEVYQGPTTGSGTPNPGFPDPMAAMNSPPVRGTFFIRDRI